MAYWDGIETIATADLDLLDRVVDTVAKAKAEAAKQAAILFEESRRELHPYVPLDLGTELTTLYLRVFCQELAELVKQRVDAANSAWFRAQRATETVVETFTALDKRFTLSPDALTLIDVIQKMSADA